MAIDLNSKRILITGAYGFLGSHLLEKMKGYAVDAPHHAEHDLVNPNECRGAFYKYRPQVVIHLAAQCGGIGANQKNPAKFWHDNLAMGMNILEQSRKDGVEKVVMVGTTCAYPKMCPTPFKEESLWDGYPEDTNAPYGIAKRALLVGAQAYRKQYGLNVITLIPTNLYGPGDHFDLENSHVIPALIRKFIEAKEDVTLWGTGAPTRDFLYAEDCARAILRACETYESGDPVNLGSGREVSIRELATSIADLIEFQGKLVWDHSKPDGQPRRLLDTRKAKEHLDWQASTPLKEGLEKTIAWYRAGCDTKRYA